ncbi:hypothetical protein V5N11_034085 [Cardamine amara subsp. amara]|uniref:Myb/SANT-like domain-containing protein n=1 Tax=Cardamine amara subsp. amara TaxID=228776 RepID=A0ABD1AN98_CARAN
MLIRLLVDSVNQGFRDASGKFNKLTVETRILTKLNEKLGSKKTYPQYRNRMKIFKQKYQSWTDLLRFSSGFGWDPETKKFTARDEVWDDYLKAHPNHKSMRDESFEDFEDLRIIFGSIIATGQNAVGLGDPIDADTYQAGEKEGTYDSNCVQMVDDADGITIGAPEHVGWPSLGRSMNEKLPQRKKARTNAFNPNSTFDEGNSMTEIGNQIFGMIQKRWEKESEDKEAEDKANNVWDAIKEIPDLDEDLRYEAMTLVHSLGMKSGFVNMSVAERNGWIQRSLRKPKP